MNKVVHRWLSTVGEEILVLPVGEPEDYNTGDPNTALVRCLVLSSTREWQQHHVGMVLKFGVANLEPWLP